MVSDPLFWMVSTAAGVLAGASAVVVAQPASSAAAQRASVAMRSG